MSSEDGSIVPIKLANRLIHVIDFHADPVTCISASSGTVSYDSIISPRRGGRSDLLLRQDAKHSLKQPPRPHQMSKIVKFPKDRQFEKVEPVDLSTFRSINTEAMSRNRELTKMSKKCENWKQVNREVRHLVGESTSNCRFSVIVELPDIRKKGEQFLVTKKTITPKLASQMRQKFGEKLHIKEIIEKAFKATKIDNSK